MGSKYFFDVETAWSFPIIQYVTDTSYVEVRKASGIAYILLELISKSEDNTEKIVVTLKNLGVPYDIHYIFGGELANMINYGIVRMKANRDFGVDLLDMYSISDFEVTDLGKRLFAAGTIPTGNNNIKRLQVYYDLSTKDILAKHDFRLFRFEDSTIDASCIANIQLNNEDVELFISENMNKYGFRKGEAITGYQHEAPEYLVYKLEDAVNIKIDQEKIFLSVKNKIRDNYIRENYSVDILSKVIGAKKKYHFPDKAFEKLQHYDYSDVEDVVKINMPSQLFQVMETKNQLSMSTGVDMKNSDCFIDRQTSSMILQQCEIEGYACYFENGRLYKILPGRFAIDVEGFQGKCVINLIVTEYLPETVSTRVLQSIFLKCLEDDEPIKKCNVVRKLSEISDCKDYVEQFAYTNLKKQQNTEDKIGFFLNINDQFKNVKFWSEVTKKAAGALFDELCLQVTIDNFAAKNASGEKLNKILKLNDLEYLGAISKSLRDTEDNEIVYEALEGLNYNEDSLLGIVNVFKVYCSDILEGDAISSRSKLGGQCALLGQSLSELKELTGVNNVTEDAAELDIDADRFIQVLATYSDSIKKLDKYRMFATDQFDDLLAYYKRYTEIKEVVTIEREASKSPSKINNNYINQMLKKSRYKDAICDLHVRLQYELNRLFNTRDMQTFELLSDVGISQYLSEDELSEMHALRKCRNEFQHPTGKRNDKYSEQIIKGWCDIVEKLGGIDNESRSTN
jgi:hypothetical protein